MKPNSKKKDEVFTDLLSAIDYLKKMNEHHTILNVDREVLIKWANFLKKHEDKKNKL